MGFISRLLKSISSLLKNTESRPRKKRKIKSKKKVTKRVSKRTVKRANPKISIKTKSKSVPSQGNKKTAAIPKKSQKQTQKEIAVVTHYFPKAGAAAMRILSEEIKMGDSLLFQGKKSSFVQKVVSLQINRIPIETGRAGEEVGLKVKKTVEEGDKVYKA